MSPGSVVWLLIVVSPVSRARSRVARMLGIGTGVGSKGGAGRDPRVAEGGDVVQRPPARRPDGEGRLAVGTVPGHELVRLVVGDHRAPPDGLEPRVAVPEVEAAGEGVELRPAHRVRGQPQGTGRLQGALVVGQGAADGDRPRGRRAVQALVALVVHGGLPALREQRRPDRPDQHHGNGRAPDRGRPAVGTGRAGAPGLPTRIAVMGTVSTRPAPGSSAREAEPLARRLVVAQVVLDLGDQVGGVERLVTQSSAPAV